MIYNRPMKLFSQFGLGNSGRVVDIVIRQQCFNSALLLFTYCSQVSLLHDMSTETVYILTDLAFFFLYAGYQSVSHLNV